MADTDDDLPAIEQDVTAHPNLNDPNNVPITFVNELSQAGYLNGVVNLTFGVARFMPWSDGTVKPDVVIASQLRMDLFAAQILRDELTRILDAQRVRPAPGEKVN